MTDHARPSAAEREAALIEQLVTTMTPVAPLWPAWRRCTVWTLLVAVPMVALYATFAPRPDLAPLLGKPAFVAEIVVLAILTVFAAWLGLRAAVPGIEATPAERTAAFAIVAAVGAQLWLRPLGLDVPLGVFWARGIACFGATIGLAVVPVATLLWGVARGASMMLGWAGAWAGLAGVTTGYVAMRLHCPIDGAAHVFVWHWVPIVVGMASAAGVAVMVCERRTAP